MAGPDWLNSPNTAKSGLEVRDINALIIDAGVVW